VLVYLVKEITLVKINEIAGRDLILMQTTKHYMSLSRQCFIKNPKA
jgi:hypothetical protein